MTTEPEKEKDMTEPAVDPESTTEPGADVVQLHGSDVEQQHGTIAVGGVHVDRDLLARTICHDLDDNELDLFVAVCNRTGLDPFAKQIYAIKRNDRNEPTGKKMGIQTSIDGFRLIAERSGRYAGQLPIQWTADGREWVDVWLSSEVPAAARAGVYKTGFAEPLVRVATWSQYAQTDRNGDPTRMWKQMPALMLGKCAEALALRAAFPAELSGLYTDDEMQQAEYAGARGNQRAIAAQAHAPDDLADADVLVDLQLRVLGLPEEQRADLAAAWRNVDKLKGVRLSAVPAGRVQLVEAMIRGVETKASKSDEDWTPESGRERVVRQLLAAVVQLAGCSWQVDAVEPAAGPDADGSSAAAPPEDRGATGSTEADPGDVLLLTDDVLYPSAAPDAVDPDDTGVVASFTTQQVDAVIERVKGLSGSVVNKVLRAHGQKAEGVEDVRRARVTLALLRELHRQQAATTE